jgi:hypothetical protein
MDNNNTQFLAFLASYVMRFKISIDNLQNKPSAPYSEKSKQNVLTC